MSTTCSKARELNGKNEVANGFTKQDSDRVRVPPLKPVSHVIFDLDGLLMGEYRLVPVH